ncbi:hypothetical protein PF70_05356 [Pseudomonas asplenii]|nr:hypothetical protein PF70_05356 [Pseudomonas fuscovaginae]
MNQAASPGIGGVYGGMLAPAGCEMPRTQTLLQTLSFLESRQLCIKEQP